MALINKKSVIKYEDFQKIQILSGTIITAEINKKARKPSYVLSIDFGSEVGIKISSAQITNYSIDELINRQIVAVCNFESRNIAGVESEVLVLGAINERNEVILLEPRQLVNNGSEIA
ncbi:tRNA-binding protein [Pelagibacteraceae bacterium]|nr:tRNA-binding protein [Pelagibacteraceae bacterium]